ERPALIVVAIQVPNTNEPVAIKLTPVEVKYRAVGMGNTEMRDALAQANNLGRVLESLWIAAPLSELWRTCAAALLAQLLDFGFRIYAADFLHRHQHAEWATVHERVLGEGLEVSARVTANTAGRLMGLGGPPPTAVADLDGDGRQDTIYMSPDDARALLTGIESISEVGNSSVQQLDF